MTPDSVWVVYEEWTIGDARAAVAGAYRTEATAQAAATTTRTELAQSGFVVWCFPTTDDQPDDWEVDVCVDEVELQP